MGRIEEALRKAKAHREARGLQPTSPNAEPQRLPARRKTDAPREVVAPVVPATVVQVNDKELLRERVITASVHDERAGPYRQLRTQLLKTMRDNRWKTLAITSAHAGAGKSLTAANLAISLSRAPDTSVLLVDLDLETPSIHEKLNFQPEKGLVDFLDGNVALEQILFDPGLSQLTVLAGRSAGKYSSELLASAKMRNLMQDLCQQNEANITIFDLPPLLRNDDALLFAPYADATLVVVEEGITTEDQLEQSIRLLEKANVIGTILNKARS